MDDFQKRGSEEDIAENIRRKLEVHKGYKRGYTQSPKISEESSAKKEIRSEKKIELKPPEEKKETKKEVVKPPRKKPKVEEETEIPRKQKKNNTPLIIVIILISFVVLIILSLIIFLVYQNRGTERELSTGLARITIKNEDIAIVTLDDSVILDEIVSVEIIFIDIGNTKYPYYPGYVAREYEIYASDLGLESFENIISVTASIEYRQERNDTPVIPPNQTNGPPSNWSEGNCTDTCVSLGYECGTWIVCGSSTNCGICIQGRACENGLCIDVCTDECSQEGLFCQGNMPYQCTLGGEGCYDRANLSECGSGEQCLNGACEIIPDCSTHGDCVDYFNNCSYGICNSTGKCELHYNSTDVCRAVAGECDLEERCTGSDSNCPANVFKLDGETCSIGVCSSGTCVECIIDDDCSSDGCYSGGYRNYYCSLESCVYEDLTLNEHIDNNNCGDGIDNDCDGQTDSADSGCFTCEPDTCESLGYECGTWGDGCGGTLDCGTCSSGLCSSGTCVECLIDSHCPADRCSGNYYLDYFCSSGNCTFTFDLCSDCSCTCGGYNQDESTSNGNCEDGKDNDCDGNPDSADSGCAAAFPTDYLAYWKFESGAEDETGNYNGQLINGSLVVSDLERGKVLSLDGVDDYVFIGDKSGLESMDEITVSLWVKSSDIFHTLISKELVWKVDFDGSKLRFLTADAWGPPYNLYSSDYADVSQWTHILAVNNGSRKCFYLNGVLDNCLDVPGGSFGNNGYAVTIGSIYNGKDVWGGVMDDVMIYNRALSESEIQSIYNAQKTEAVFSISPFVGFWNWIRELF